MPDARPRLLIVDDEATVLRLTAAVGEELGLRCRQASSIEAALRQMESEPCELVLADLHLNPGSGLELLAAIKHSFPRSIVALMSANGSLEVAIEAMRLGACDFLVKPFTVQELQRGLGRMVELLAPADEGGERAAPGCTDLQELERRTVQQVFSQVEGDKELACRLLGISRATLYRRIKRYGIQPQAGDRASLANSPRAADEAVVILTQS